MPTISPGKRTLTDAVSVQLSASAHGATPANRTASSAVQEAAAQGVVGGGGPLPHAETIQRLFGRHDVSGVEAHVGGSAATASRAIGAEAYATGHHVAFASAPSLHTAAHEAAHVVQQRGGVQLKGGVGESGDAHEQHADAVADRVVAGASAVDLLDRYAAADAGSSPVQRRSVQRKDYGSTTVGVEQELTGHKILISDAKDRGVIGVVSKGGADLVEFTSDMGKDGVYTIELRTTPCEKSDKTATELRKTAIATMLKAIEAAGRDRQGVPTQDLDGFHIEIVNSKHRIQLDDHATGFANQASLGVKTDDLVTGAGDGALLMKYVAVTWYQADLAKDMPTDGLVSIPKATRVYAMLASTIGFLADIVRPHGEKGLHGGEIAINLYEPSIKDRWEVLPRTPPWEWLDVLNTDDKAKVAAQLRGKFAADDFNKAALSHITSKKDLAGHKVPDATIGGQHSSIFEFRTVPAELQEYLHNGMEIPQEVAKKYDSTLLQVLKTAPHMKRRAKHDESESESESEGED